MRCSLALPNTEKMTPLNPRAPATAMAAPLKVRATASGDAGEVTAGNSKMRRWGRGRVTARRLDSAAERLGASPMRWPYRRCRTSWTRRWSTGERPRQRAKPALPWSRCRLAWDDCQPKRDVRFTSTNRHPEAGASGPKSANKRLMQCGKWPAIQSPRRRERASPKAPKGRAI